MGEMKTHEFHPPEPPNALSAFSNNQRSMWDSIPQKTLIVNLWIFIGEKQKIYMTNPNNGVLRLSQQRILQEQTFFVLKV